MGAIDTEDYANIGAGPADADSSDSDGSLGISSSLQQETPQSNNLDSSASTLEVSNRGRSRQRSSGKKNKGTRRKLRTKFEIESLYMEISELRRQNEALKRIYANVRGTNSSAKTQQSIPSMVRVDDSDASHRSGSDLEISTSDRTSHDGGKGCSEKIHAEGDGGDVQMEMHRAFHSLVLDKGNHSSGVER